MTARLSSCSSLPETPTSDTLRSQLRACYGVQESPLKRRTSGWRPFSDDTAKELRSQGCLPQTHHSRIAPASVDDTAAAMGT